MKINKQGITTFVVKNAEEANSVCKELLYENCNPQTALFLSGGRTPKDLYSILAEEKKLKVGAVVVTDDRFGQKFHEKSNELMIAGTKLLSYLEEKNIKFYPVLENKNIDLTTKDFDETLRYIFNYFPKSVGILGVGADGHTAGIPAILEISEKILEDKESLALNFDDSGKYGQRITMTFNALAKLDLLILIVVGEDKKEALDLMFSEGSIDEIPARFYLRPEIAEKTILITDQF